jgi:hypothetical protein
VLPTCRAGSTVMLQTARAAVSVGRIFFEHLARAGRRAANRPLENVNDFGIGVPRARRAFPAGRRAFYSTKRQCEPRSPHRATECLDLRKFYVMDHAAWFTSSPYGSTSSADPTLSVVTDPPRRTACEKPRSVCRSRGSWFSEP